MDNDNNNNLWNLRIMGEITFPTHPQYLLKYFPHLVICMRLYLEKDLLSQDDCISMSKFHYEAYFYIQSPSPVIVIQSWAQLTLQGGKLKDSNNFISLDFRMRSFYSRLLPSIELNVGDCKPINLICEIESIKVPLCINNITNKSIIEFSIQQISNKLCSQSNLNHISCPIIISKISNCVHKRVMETQLNLPTPQYLPSPESPFIFLHIEKTAGSTTRK